MINTAKKSLVYGIILLIAAVSIHSFWLDIIKIKISALNGGWWAVWCAAGLSLFNYFLRILRWHQYLKILGHHLPFKLSALSYMAGFAFTLSPGKVGEVVRARYYKKYNVPLAHVAAIFFFERILDLVAIMALALFLLASVARFQTLLVVASLLVVGLVLTLTFFPWARLKKASWKPLRLIAETLEQVRSLLQLPLIASGLFLGLLAWGGEGLGFALVGEVIRPVPQLDVMVGVGIYATATLVGALSFLPGGLGTTEAVMSSLLYAQAFSVSDALLLTLVCRLLTLWLAVGIGWICIWLMRHEH